MNVITVVVEMRSPSLPEFRQVAVARSDPVGPPRTEKLPAGPDHEGEHPLEVTEFGRSAVGQTHGERSMMIPSPPGMVSVFSWSWNVMARPLLDPAIGNVLRSNEAKLTQLLRANVTSTFAPGSNQTPRSPSGVA